MGRAWINGFILCLLVVLGTACDETEPVEVILRENPDYYVIREEGLYGFIDSEGNTVIPCAFLDTRPFSNGLAAAKTEDGWGYIDSGGEWVINPQYLEVQFFHDGVAMVGKNNLVGRREFFWINTAGQEVYTDIDNIVSDFRYGYSRIHENGLYHVIDNQGNIINKTGYRGIGPLSDGLFVFRSENDNKGAFDVSGNVVIEPVHRTLGQFSEGLAYFVEDMMYGYMNTDGEVVIEPQFHQASVFSDGLAHVYIGETQRFIDPYGETVFRPGVSGLYYDFSEGLCRVRHDGSYGYVNTDGRMVIQPEYVTATDFNEGRAIVTTEEGRGVIDYDGNYVIELAYYTLITEFHKGVALAEYDTPDGLPWDDDEYKCATKAYVYFDRDGNIIYGPSEGVAPYRDIGDTSNLSYDWN